MTYIKRRALQEIHAYIEEIWYVVLPNTDPETERKGRGLRYSCQLHDNADVCLPSEHVRAIPCRFLMWLVGITRYTGVMWYVRQYNDD